MNRFTDPDLWWDAIEPQLGSRRLTIALFLLAVVGALGVAAACEIGIRHFNTDWNYVLGYRVQRNRTWQPFFMLWAGVAIAPVIQGVISAALLKIYDRPRRWLNAVVVAIVGSIPMYIAGLTLVLLPGILLFAVAFLISCGWWASGNRRLLGIRYSESAEHVAVSLVVSGALLLLLSASVPV